LLVRGRRKATVLAPFCTVRAPQFYNCAGSSHTTGPTTLSSEPNPAHDCCGSGNLLRDC
jgi:hypothetical protein